MIKRLYILSIIFNTPEIYANPAASLPIAYALATSATSELLQINSTKLYGTASTLSINDNINILKNLKQKFKKNSFLE